MSVQLKPVASTLKSALIGAGRVSQDLHIPAHRELAGSELKWIMDVQADGARAMADHYAVPYSTDRFQDILRDPEINWVDITTPNSTHARLTIEALKAGKHVLVQKPLASNAEDARLMLETAREENLSLGVFMCFRGDPGVLAIKRLIDTGALGGLISIRGKMISGSGFTMTQGTWRSEEGVGGLMLLGIHMLDLFDFYLGKPQWAFAEAKTIHTAMKGDDAAYALLGYENGITGILETTYCSYVGSGTPMYTLEIGGTDGFAAYRLETGELTVQLKHEAQIGPHAYLPVDGVAALKFDQALGGGAHFVAHQRFVDELSAGQPNYEIAEAGIRALETIRAIQDSSSTGIRIRLDDNGGTRESTGNVW